MLARVESNCEYVLMSALFQNRQVNWPFVKCLIVLLLTCLKFIAVVLVIVIYQLKFLFF